MFDFSDSLRLGGEEFQLWRDGRLVAALQGVRHEQKGKIEFPPDTLVRQGDVSAGRVCGQEYSVIRTNVVTIQAKRFCIEAFYRQPHKGSGPNVTIGTMVSSAFMYASPNSSQSINLNSDLTDDLRQLLRRLVNSLDEIGLSDSDKAEVREDAEYLKKKVEGGKPEPGLIRECIASIRKKLSDAAAAAVATGVITNAQHYLELVNAFCHNHFGS